MSMQSIQLAVSLAVMLTIAACHSSSDGMALSCVDIGGACQANADCCQDTICDRAQKTCVAGSNLTIGEPCDTSDQCASGSCYIGCSRACSTNADCVGVGKNLCDGATGSCVPSCATNADCAIYGTETCYKACYTDPAKPFVLCCSP